MKMKMELELELELRERERETRDERQLRVGVDMYQLLFISQSVVGVVGGCGCC